MKKLHTRRSFHSVEYGYRVDRPATDKMIFLSIEGSATEEDYFNWISYLFEGIKSKIQFVSVAEDIVSIEPKNRSREQVVYLSKNKPLDLVKRIDEYKINKESQYEFSKHPDDEFWIITDVDENWSNKLAHPSEGKTKKDDWDEAIRLCVEKGYGYAVSNPFFEVWLLLHHDSVTEEDKSFAVTDSHEYEATTHFNERLFQLGAPLKKKHIKDFSKYTIERIEEAIKRAEELHINKDDLEPRYLASTVYILIKKVLDLSKNGCSC